MVKPVQVTRVENFKSINTLSDPELTFDLGVQNPNKFGVTVSGMEMSLFNGDSKLVGVRLMQKSRIPGNRTVSLPVSMKPTLSSISALFKSEISNWTKGKGSQKMELRGTIVMKKFIFTRKIKLKEPVRF